MDEALRDAAQAGDCKALLSLMADGADVNMTDDHGRSALHLAVQCNSDDCVAELLRRDADVTCEDERGATPLHVAAARPASNEVLKLLLVSSADLNATDRSGWTPLHHAAIRGHECVLSKLLESIEGAVTVSATDAYGSTPLHWACIHGHAAFVARLLKDANQQVLPHAVVAKNAQGKTAADLARQYRHDHVTQLLQKWQANKEAEAAAARQPWRRSSTASASAAAREDMAMMLSRTLSGSLTDPHARRVSQLPRQALQPKHAIDQPHAIDSERRDMLAQERTSMLPATQLQRTAMNTVVSFDSAGGGATVHSLRINDD